MAGRNNPNPARHHEWHAPDGKVYELYVAQWRELKRCPKHHDMAMELGITGSTLDGALNRLARDGRMIHVRRGVWLPKVV